MSGRGTAAEAFWRFSLMVYSRSGLAEALLQLQDQGGHNVNLVLYGLWLGLCEGVPLDAAGLARARSAIDKLDRDSVLPLRALRRALKGDPDPDVQGLRRRVLALEIAAERQVQARLAALPQGSAHAAERRMAAEANLRLVLGEDFVSNEARLLLLHPEA